MANYEKTSVRVPSQPPPATGVYFFLDKNKKVLYVGKAVNIQSRVRSHFAETKNSAKAMLLKETRSLKWELAASEPEALIRECELIKKLKPRYNVLLKDDKNYTYVGITRESFPKVFITHQLAKTSQNTNVHKTQIRYVGPFTDGNALKHVLKNLRKAFPYCTCRRSHKRECLAATLGRCMGTCCLKANSTNHPPEARLAKGGKQHPSEWTTGRAGKSQTLQIKRLYRKNIRVVEAILRGERPRLLPALTKEMAEASRDQRFEEAARLRDQIGALKNIFSHRPVVAGHALADERIRVLQELNKLVCGAQPPTRIEMYDMSNIQGTLAVGSMVVFMHGLPDKSHYRKFRIRAVEGIDDTAMMREVIGRRLKHTEWPLPDILAVDGGKGQMGAAIAAIRELRSADCAFPIIGLAKGRDELHWMPSIRHSPSAIRTIQKSRLSRNLRNFLNHLQDEAHRFAITYHRKLRVDAIARLR